MPWFGRPHEASVLRMVSGSPVVQTKAEVKCRCCYSHDAKEEHNPIFVHSYFAINYVAGYISSGNAKR